MPKLVNRGAAGLLSKSQTSTLEQVERPKKGPLNNIRCEGKVVLISTLKSDPENARLHPERNMLSIEDSLNVYGQMSPVTVRKQNMTVMKGNGTMTAAKNLGWTKIAASIIPMTDVEAAGYGIADNRTAEFATWNFEVVAKLDKMMTTAGQPNVGWSPEELAAMRSSLEPRVNPDKVPEIPADPVTVKGDLWTLGNHRLLCGDSIDVKAIKRLMNGKKAVLMATDPPYGVAFGEKNYCATAKDWGAIQGDKLQGDELRKWLANVLKTWLPFVSNDAAYYIWSASLSEGHRFYEAILDAGLHVQSQIIWSKNRFALGQADYQWMHEPVWYAFKKKGGDKHRWFGGRDKTTVWVVDKVVNSEYLHPTQKPVDLFRLPMEYHTKHGEICCEPFSGSGSQIMAAELSGRACYAMEIDEKFCDVALQRWMDATGKSPVRHDGKSFRSLLAAKNGAGNVR